MGTPLGSKSRRECGVVRRQAMRGIADSPWPEEGRVPSLAKTEFDSWCQPSVVSSMTRLLANASVNFRFTSMGLFFRIWASVSAVPKMLVDGVTSGCPVAELRLNSLRAPDEVGVA